MRNIRLTIFAVIMMTGLAASMLQVFNSPYAQAQNTAQPEAIILTLSGPVTPTIADYLSREIALASQSQKELIIIEIDTPGGLVTSMETIIKAILRSDTPVATYVSPRGAKSASAGPYIMYAAHISAMAPATNTGSATPIQIGGNQPELEPVNKDDEGRPDDRQEENTQKDAGDNTPLDGEELRKRFEEQIERRQSPLSNNDALRAKIINNSVAYIKSLAELRGRNAQWAEKAVREAANVTAKEALNLNVIDLIAEDMDDLLAQIDGKSITVKNQPRTLSTNNMTLNRIEPTTVERILGFFSDPNVAAILMSIGMLGITVELWNPGSIFPGAIGIICLLLGLYAAQTLPFTWLGIGLMLAGTMLIMVEAYTTAFGVAGILGLAAFSAGLYLLFPDSLRVSNSVIFTSVALVGSFLALILFALVGSRSHGPLIGAEAIANREGYVDDWDGLEGYVVIEGERWQARSARPLEPGDTVKVIKVDGLILVVKKSDGPGLLRRSEV